MVKPGVSVVIADMTATSFCDSLGVRALLLAHERAVRNGAELRLLRPRDPVQRVLALTGADQLLVSCESVGQQ